MALHHALLSQLAAGETYGYELKRAFERSGGAHWGTLNIGHLYQVLDRLKRDGLVEVVRSERRPRRPDRVIYAITPAGREELRRWLETAAPPVAGYRDDLYLKLAAAARAGADELRELVRRERRAHLAELQALRGLEAADALAGLLTEGAALLVEARLRMLDRAEQDAAVIAADAAAADGAPPAAAAERRAS